MSLLPIFLKLDNRPGLLVGAGTVALDKIGSLLKTGIKLRVVAPQAHPEIRRLANEGKLEWIERSFQSSDLDDNFLVIAATDNPEVNAAVYRGALDRNILCNSVDDIPNCDFFFGSIVSRGDLQIAISTAGESPAFAQRLRREIDEQLPIDLGPWLTNLGELRRDVLAFHPRSEERKLLLHELAHRQICDSPTCATRQFARASEATSNKQAVILSEGRRAAEVEVPAVALGKPDSTGRVYLVGAGPGDPDLLTVKALRLIQSADIILHDDLVPQPILDLAAPTAEIVNVGKRCGAKSITQEEIHALMIRHGRANRSVVRLKSGDPLVFGRAAEEITALAAAEVPFEIVPGITAAFAAAAAVGCSLTSRNTASNVVFSTGHHAASHNSAAIPQLEDATRVVYMPGRDLHLLALEWLDEGLPPDFPCALISRAGQAGQQIRCTTLAALGDAEPVPAPSLLIAGWAIRESAAIRQSAAEGASVKA
jgi:uroporphyrin-III C-methyltransferase / precorrin-2 dehydrogenase / sirohydrochlorin ferrochelatase